MKIVDLVTAAKTANPSAFGNVSDARATAIVRAVFGEIAWTVDSIDTGDVSVVGLGKFVAKNVPVNKAGTQTTERRVIFRTVRRAKSTE
jgi:hypothetical protein